MQTFEVENPKVFKKPGTSVFLEQADFWSKEQTEQLC